MSANKKQVEVTLNDHSCTYVFETKEEMRVEPPSKFRKKIWQVIPSVCATLMCLPYGIMLGWPSPTYPILIQSDAPIVLSMDQTAMVTGFLMIGNTIAAPFSSFRKIGAKYGIITGAVLQTLGWIVLWQAQDFYWLLGGRLLIGAGNGFGLGQLTFYISEICQDSLAKLMIKQVNLYAIFGLVLAFTFGPFVNFRYFSIISTIISILVLFLTIFLPSTPRELVQNGKNADARKLIAFLSPQLDVSEEMNKIKERINLVDNSLCVCDIIRNSSLRKNFAIFTFLVIFQQGSGGPPFLNYCQMVLADTGCPHPELGALIYSFTFFLANIYCTFCSPKRCKKRILIFSSVGVSVLLIVFAVVLMEKVNQTVWNFSSLVVLLFYVIVYTIGLGAVPVTLIQDLFPKEGKRVMLQYFLMLHSMSALIITKVFQVMFVEIGLVAPLFLFFVFSAFSLILVIAFLPNERKSVETT